MNRIFSCSMILADDVRRYPINFRSAYSWLASQQTDRDEVPTQVGDFFGWAAPGGRIL